MNVDDKNNMCSFGFTTASGSSIRVSNKALSKAKNLFIEEFKDVDNYEEICKIQEEINESNVQLPSVEFQTASGSCINISNKALLKAETLFSNEIAENTNNVISLLNYQTAKCTSVNDSDKVLLKQGQSENNVKQETDKDNISSINIGFKTASGKLLRVTEQAIQKAEMLLSESVAENIENMSYSSALKIANSKLCNVFKDDVLNTKQILENNTKSIEKSNKLSIIETKDNKSELQNTEFQTASGQFINITTGALLKSNAAFYEDTLKDFENCSMLTTSLPKRKIKDLDSDDISLNKSKSNHFKKLRFSNPIQSERLNCGDSINTDEKENQELTSRSTVLILNCDVNKSADSVQGNKTDEKSNEVDNSSINSLISHEIVASTVALLADEKNSFDQWISPTESNKNEEMLNVPSSPVIGGQFISRKRRSISNKKRTANASNTLKQSNDNCISSTNSIEKETKHLVHVQEPMNGKNRCDISVANEFDGTQLMMEFINESEHILQKRCKAALEQAKQISLKEKYKPKPTTGTLYLYRRTHHNNRISWREISNGNKPVPCTCKELIERKLPFELLDISADNAIRFKFQCSEFYGQDFIQCNTEGIKLKDGAYLILDENGCVGITEIKRSFLASPGVDPNLLFNGWVENHYKWIVWKLASMDRIKLGSIILSRALTPARVMMELKYRYDREIDRTQRSALRKILEKDDVPSKRMVLCVSSITEDDDCTIANSSKLKAIKKIILTDGWYSIQASIDQAMIKNILSGKVKEGTKLVTYGSELLNCDEGCSPLEVPSNVCLKIHTNSTRRARWDAKLGYIIPSGPLCIKLRTINSNGGLVGKIKVLITRIYPMLYREKATTGESIFRNARCEEKADIAHEKECRLVMEAFYAKIEKQFSTETRKDHSSSANSAIIDWNEDCENLSKKEFVSKKEFEQLNNNYRIKEEEVRQKLKSQLQETLPPPRQVTPLLKIRVVEEETSALLSIWSPSEEITDILKEGNFVSVCNVIPLGKRGNELQLNANRNTLFKPVNASDINYPRRTCTPLCDISKPDFAPAYGELDTVGVIVGIGNEPYGMKHFEAVYLAYPDTNFQSSYILILFWHGIASHGYAEILTIGSFVACSNLEWRQATSWNIPMTYCTERSTFSRNPRQHHFQQPFEHLKRLIKDTTTYTSTCLAEISKEVQKKLMTRVSNSYVQQKNNIQFQDNPKPITVQERLEKLRRYSEPPSLSPITLNNSSKRVFSEFQSPIRSVEKEPAKNHVLLQKRFTQNSR